jgi:hypothetical protein
LATHCQMLNCPVDRPTSGAVPDGWSLTPALRALHCAILEVYETPEFWRVLGAEHLGFGPFDGGCGIVATGIQMAYGGDIVTLVDRLGRAHHYGVMVADSVFDFDGAAASPADWVARFCRNEALAFPLFFAAHQVPSDSIPYDRAVSRRIADLLSSALERGDVVAGTCRWAGLPHHEVVTNHGVSHEQHS